MLQKNTQEIPQWLKISLDIVPLGLFFFFTSRYDIYFATAAFIIASVVSLALHWHFARKISYVLLSSVLLVVIFGSFTLIFHDALFIKLKPTILNFSFALVLFVGLKMNKNILEMLMGENIQLPRDIWNTLTKRWIVFFIVMGGINEIVWRNFSTEFWAGFKLFGFLPLTIIFISLQLPLITSHQKDKINKDRD